MWHSASTLCCEGITVSACPLHLGTGHAPTALAGPYPHQMVRQAGRPAKGPAVPTIAAQPSLVMVLYVSLGVCCHNRLLPSLPGSSSQFHQSQLRWWKMVTAAAGEGDSWGTVVLPVPLWMVARLVFVMAQHQWSRRRA